MMDMARAEIATQRRHIAGSRKAVEVHGRIN